ncbi:MAG: zinc ribbon domain-containing protein [Firmicutes bacterium]|nr:zinc ribbon domain-containing protein [Bacillota bacterium]
MIYLDILHKVGEKAKEIGGMAKELGGMAKEVTRKSGELLEVTKMKFEMSKLEKELENNLAGLGTVVYQKYRGTEDMDSEIDRLCQSTVKLEEEMRALQQQIDKLQPKSLSCPDCKNELPPGGKFCTYCGIKVTKED